MNYTSTNVYNYLSFMERYLVGDLATFHNVCLQIEAIETIPTPPITASNAGSMYGPPPATTSTTTTPQGTAFNGVTNSSTILQQTNSPEYYRLTIPITLTLFAVVDYLGYLSGANDDPLKTNKNFKEFFKQSSIAVSEKESEMLNWLFRQGLTHVYFPKLGLGISYHSKNPAGKLLFRTSASQLVLNVNRLEEIVLSTFKSVKENSALYPQMEVRYAKLIADYQSKYSVDIAGYPA